MIYFAEGSPTTELSDGDVREALQQTIAQCGSPSRVLALPPDFTRFASQAGKITCMLHEMLGDALSDVMPALGTHDPISDAQREKMYPGIPESLFRSHDWRNDVQRLGWVPGEFVQRVTEGLWNKPWPAQLNKLITRGGHDLILSIGQVVPHEVIGMANYNKNIFVGTGGSEGINESHYLSAVYGMERVMGRAKTPLRAILNEAERQFCADLPLVYILTVISRNELNQLVIRGLYIGDDPDCFERAAELSLQVNFELVDPQPDHIVAYLDPDEFHSTWLGNKAIYRTRMLIADGGLLTILAPAVNTFGEDKEIDALIRRFGYRSKDAVQQLVEEHPDLRNNLSAAAHLIHGSPEGRFTIRYCPGGLSREEVESVGYEYGDLRTMLASYPPDELKDGWNDLRGQKVFFVRNPALGLWAHPSRLDDA